MKEYTIEFTAEAEEDLSDAYLWYHSRFRSSCQGLAYKERLQKLLISEHKESPNFSIWASSRGSRVLFEPVGGGFRVVLKPNWSLQIRITKDKSSMADLRSDFF